MSYLDKSIEEIKKALDNKEVTSLELVNESLKRAKKYQNKFNSFVTITEDKAINDTNNIEKINNNPLKGIPYALKDNFSTKGILSTASSNILKDYVPFFNATAYQKLEDCGAILIGKTVLDELAMGGSGTTGHTGVVKNPWDENRLIGGSSAGSASAVASGIVPFSIGSDTGDSIRKPAAYGGIVGYKPTYGLISRYGLFAFASSLDHVGCFTRYVKDVAYVLDAIKGRDKEHDMTSLPDDNIKFSDNITGNVKGKKLFYLKEIIDRNNYKDTMDDELEQILDKFDETIKYCEELGISVTAVDFNKELIKAIFPAYITISCAEATSNNSNLTGVIFGNCVKGNSVDEVMYNTRTNGFSEFIKRRFVLGSYILQKENQERLFLNAGRVRRLIVDKMTEFFKEFDGMILPAALSIAPTFKSEVLDKLSDRYLFDNHMAIGNFGGFPSITIPNGFVKNMPIAINITSGIKKDLDLLNIAYAIEGKMEYKGQIARSDK